MILIFGGAYQGKLDFTKEKYHITDDEIFFCTENSPLDFSKKVIYDTELFFLKCVKEGINPVDILKGNLTALKDKIIIASDISQGIVPMEAVNRAWREASGRAMLYLAKESDEVYRIFCGLSHQLK